nr:substrate-binding domain-containing protein [Micromonospora sp. DSM 115978]
MSPSRHRARRASSPTNVVSRVAVVVLLLSGVTLAATLALRDSDSVTACTGSLVVTVEVAATVEAPVRQAADAYQRTFPAVESRCVEFAVTSRPPGESAAMFSTGWSDAAAGPVPDVWMPDSVAWLDAARNETAGRALL